MACCSCGVCPSVRFPRPRSIRVRVNGKERGERAHLARRRVRARRTGRLRAGARRRDRAEHRARARDRRPAGVDVVERDARVAHGNCVPPVQAALPAVALPARRPRGRHAAVLGRGLPAASRRPDHRDPARAALSYPAGRVLPRAGHGRRARRTDGDPRRRERADVHLRRRPHGRDRSRRAGCARSASCASCATMRP